MKKYILIAILIIVIIISSIFIIKNNRYTKYYLDDNYYNNSDFIEIDSNEFNNYTNGNYLLYVYTNFCMFSTPCETIFKEFMSNNNISMLSMKYSEFKTLDFHNTVKYGPTVIIVKDGNIVAYLDTEKDKDLEKYQDTEKFTKWINKYIYLKK